MYVSPIGLAGYRGEESLELIYICFKEARQSALNPTLLIDRQRLDDRGLVWPVDKVDAHILRPNASLSDPRQHSKQKVFAMRRQQKLFVLLGGNVYERLGQAGLRARMEVDLWLLGSN